MRIQLDIQNKAAVLYYLRDRLKPMHFCVQGNTEQGLASWPHNSTEVCRYFIIDIETRQFYWSSADDVPPFVEPNVIDSVEEAIKLLDFVEQNQNFLQDEEDDIALFDMPQPVGSEWEKLKKVSEELQKVAMEMGHPILMQHQKKVSLTYPPDSAEFTSPWNPDPGLNPCVVYAPYIPLYKTVDSLSGIGGEMEKKISRILQKKWAALKLDPELYKSFTIKGKDL